MRVEALFADAHPDGFAIELTWFHPTVTQFPGLRVVRAKRSHPVNATPAPGAGVVVADTSNPGELVPDADGSYRVSDTGLKAETVYYYTIFPYRNDPPEYQQHRANRTAALTVADNGLAEWMYDQLPAIYHRYDRIVPRNGLSAEDANHGQLRRFLDLPGDAFGRAYSLTRALLHAHDPETIDGRLLPLLASWIGWKTDTLIELGRQRDEIRAAPLIYQRIGVVPMIAATLKRVNGWQSQPKEFIDNLFVSNRPERLNWWTSQRDGGGSWTPDDQPFSMDSAYHGRATSATDADGLGWLFFSSSLSGRAQLRAKSFDEPAAAQPSLRFVESGRNDQHPTAATNGAILWLFWESHDPHTGRWQLHFRTRAAGAWSDSQVFADPLTDRRRPALSADGEGGLWLFYQQHGPDGWVLRYNRHDGTDWELTDAAVFPDDGGAAPRVESDPFVLVRPGADRRLWLFWSERRALGSDASQSRWQVAFRVKDGLDSGTATDWNGIATIVRDDDVDHDREPMAVLDPAGDIELFLSSTADGSWSIWTTTLAAADATASPRTAITTGPFSQRAPLAMASPTGTTLVYGSNRSITYRSEFYPALSVDRRYSGSTTLARRDAAKRALRGSFDDFQTYSYDRGRDDDDWIARDTVGVYFEPTPGLSDAAIDAAAVRAGAILRDFVPARDRTVLVRNNS